MKARKNTESPNRSKRNLNGDVIYVDVLALPALIAQRGI